MGIEIPEKYGGTGCNFMTTILIVEELAKIDGSVAALVDIHNTLVNSLIMKVASEEQKQKYLPRLAQDYVSQNEHQMSHKNVNLCMRIAFTSFFTFIKIYLSQAGSFCLTESGSGSDAFSLKTEAKKDGLNYVLNGTKMWISNSDIARLFIVFANANTSAVSSIVLAHLMCILNEYRINGEREKIYERFSNSYLVIRDTVALQHSL